MDKVVSIEALTQEILIRLGDRYASMFVRIWQPAAQPRGTVFCLHGFTGNGADFDYLAAFLCRNGYLVICPDLLGRGRSAYLGSGYDIEVYSRCLRALGQFAGKENHFVGTSWGGLILILFLYTNRGRVDKIVLNDVPMIGGPRVDALRREVIQESTLIFETRAAAREYLRASKPSMVQVEQPVLDRFIDNRIASGPGGFRFGFDPATTGNFEAMTGREYDLFPMMAKLDARVMLMYSRESEFVERKALERARRARPDLCLVDNIDVGNSPSLMTPDQLYLILGFLSAA
ncbi:MULTISPECIES: alpha/beta hydrolase [unclassified Mesorhizobium]|uniref:alpha/beta hydrolase n=1 Tax=unclassified Mesorhizobium TaxID=325217 RepID=UPI0024170119|nr:MULTISPECIES: alpha/beta hydrolase [unclassified Mesorhizobium]MDG4904013.1 alpha/beta hydrolase [Mesorhizobium sp. WSM4962]MDG4921205.1 alpha/beta hydrolase [Mesorhizobium sp. WSM4989]